jgi:hypothetical protein
LLSIGLLLFLNRKTEKLVFGIPPSSPPPQGNSRGSVLPCFVIYPLSTKAQNPAQSPPGEPEKPKKALCRCLLFGVAGLFETRLVFFDER